MPTDRRKRGFEQAMRLTARIVAVTAAAAVIGGGITAWAATDTGSGTRSASGHVAAAPRRSPAARSRPDNPQGRPADRGDRRAAGVKAKAAVLADAATGQVLWGRGLNTELPMASVTKVMTALVVLESGHLDQEIRVPRRCSLRLEVRRGERGPESGR